MDSAKVATEKTKKATATLATSIKNFTKRVLTFGLLVKLFHSIATTAKEGFQGLAKYSDEFNGVMSEFTSQTATLKASFASAFAPIANVVVPLLTQLVSWLNTGCDALARFFAYLQGKTTYTKAKQNLVDYRKELNKTNDAAKNVTASFDDLNVLDSGSASGGASATAPMFEEGTIDPSKFEWVEWVEEHLTDIAEIAGLVAVALGTWKISSALGADFRNIAGDVLTITGLTSAVIGFFDAWKNGLDLKNVSMIIGGIAASVTGLLILGAPIAAAIAAVVGGIALLVLGVKEWIETGELSDKAFTAMEVGLGAVGVALTLVTGPIGGVIALVSMLALAIYKNWDAIKSKTIEIWTAIKTFFIDTWDKIKTGVSDRWNALKTGLANAFDAFKTTVKTKWDAVKNTFTTVWETIKSSVTGIWEKLKNGVVTGVESMKTSIKIKLEAIKNTFVSIFESIWSKIKKVINTILGGIEGLVNGVINGLNFMINALNKLQFDVPEWVPVIGGGTFGFNIPNIKTVEIPRLATGGIVDRPTTALIGEAGREAVIPLENNTEWMDALAQKVSSNVTIKFDGTLSQLAKVLKPALDAESSRIGTNLIVQ